MAQIKVWCCSFGTIDRLVATTSQRAAADAMRISLYEFRNYASETGNREDCELALANPGVLFTRSNRRYGEPWERAEP